MEDVRGGVTNPALFHARTKRGNGEAWPKCAIRYSGPVFVAGNAWCLHDDIEEGRKIIGNAPVIAVNGASQEVKSIALFSYHPHRFIEKGCEWIRHQKRLFGTDFTVHASRQENGMPFVDYWWEDARGGGGSAWGARKLAWLLGFETVVMVGCPLTPGNYSSFKPGMIMTRDDILDPYRREIESDKDWHIGCYSMSGWTKEFFGCP
jgi:hypothetical protein